MFAWLQEWLQSRPVPTHSILCNEQTIKPDITTYELALLIEGRRKDIPYEEMSGAMRAAVDKHCLVEKLT